VIGNEMTVGYEDATDGTVVVFNSSLFSSRAVSRC
jgi:hypothetical protein